MLFSPWVVFCLSLNFFSLILDIFFLKKSKSKNLDLKDHYFEALPSAVYSYIPISIIWNCFLTGYNYSFGHFTNEQIHHVTLRKLYMYSESIHWLKILEIFIYEYARNC